MSSVETSFIIPSRNEIYLEQTVRDILKNMRGSIEVIVMLDGYLPNPQLDMKDDRVLFVHNTEPIGQRASINKGARIANGKYICKADAHTAFDEGYDLKMIAECKYDYTLLARMFNLDVSNWKPKLSKKTDFMWIRSPKDKDKPLRHNYWDGTCSREFPEEYKIHKDMDYRKGDICDVMTGQGACWFMHKDRFWELGGMDEAHGSWGAMGIEIALKAWLSGGSQKVNKKTWFAHFFRGGNGPGFPYEIKGRDQEKARKYAIDMWTNNKWDKQKRPLQWLVDKFAPLPTWEKKTGRPVIQGLISATKWIAKGRIFDVKDLHTNRLAYARPNKLKGIQWLASAFSPVVTQILEGTQMTEKDIHATDYYRYLVSKLNPAVRKDGKATPKGELHIRNKFRDLENLCKSMKTIGMMSPLDMYMDGEHPILTRGARRLEIAFQLGWKTIPVRIWRTEQLGRGFIPTAAWQNTAKTVHGIAVKQFVKCGAEATDKYWVHGYTPYYDHHMEGQYQKHIKILELGVKTGKSLEVWRDAFPKAQIYGIDKKLLVKESDRIKLFEFDLGDQVMLNKMAEKHGKFDLIVDDALHRPKEQRANFNILFSHLNFNGVYAIEDVHQNYRDKFRDISVVEDIKKLVDSIWLDHRIKEVSFYPNICFVRKT